MQICYVYFFPRKNNKYIKIEINTTFLVKNNSAFSKFKFKFYSIKDKFMRRKVNYKEKEDHFNSKQIYKKYFYYEIIIFVKNFKILPPLTNPTWRLLKLRAPQKKKKTKESWSESTEWLRQRS